MRRVYTQYMEWEDFKNGMYETNIREDETILIRKGELLLSNPKRFKKIANEVIKYWPISTTNHLTNTGINRRSWLGQAACNYAHGIPEILTRISWSRMTKKAQDLANGVAMKIIKQYEKDNSIIYNNVENPLLF